MLRALPLAIVCALAAAPGAFAFPSTGRQSLLVTPVEHEHAAIGAAGTPRGCRAEDPDKPMCTRHTADQWQAILQKQLNDFYLPESYYQTYWTVRVLKNPNSANGWWPARHTISELSAKDTNLFVSDPALARDA